MPDALVARQPILDRRARVVGYELLFRSGHVDHAEILDSEGASAAVALNSLTEIGVEQLTAGHDAWLNVSRQFILSGYAELLPRGKFVLELLEDQLIDKALIRAVKALTSSGYRIALDDFSYSPEMEPLLTIASYVKLDLLALGRDLFREHVERLRRVGLQIVAEKVETEEEHRFCARLGCRLFQGYYFAKPQIHTRERVDMSRTSLLKLMFALNDPEVELDEVEREIAKDPNLTYRLLRYMNSAQIGLSNIRSVPQAVSLLGLKQLQRWAALSLYLTADGKPAELGRLALTRARFCELSANSEPGMGPNEMFMAGLMSVLDALLDEPLEEALTEVPLAPQIVDVILGGDQPGASMLEAVRALEQGDIDIAESLAPQAAPLYVDSLAWVDAIATGSESG